MAAQPGQGAGSGSGSGSNLYRAPTWVREIQFDGPNTSDIAASSSRPSGADVGSSTFLPSHTRQRSSLSSISKFDPAASTTTPPTTTQSTPRAGQSSSNTPQFRPSSPTTMSAPIQNKTSRFQPQPPSSPAMMSAPLNPASSSSATSSPRYQPNRTLSSSPEWSRARLPIPPHQHQHQQHLNSHSQPQPQPPPPQPYGGSSADSYARLDLHPDESTMLPGSFFRPETALSTWSQDDRGDPQRQQMAASSYETHNTTDSSSNNPKRASILSFQTALSGGVHSLQQQRSFDGLRDYSPSPGVPSPTTSSRRPGSAGLLQDLPQPSAGNNSGINTYDSRMSSSSAAAADRNRFSQPGQTNRRVFSGNSSQPSSAQASPVIRNNKPLDSPRAAQEPLPPPPGPAGSSVDPSNVVTLDRNRTVRPSHGRHSSNQNSLDFKDQLALPTATASAAAAAEGQDQRQNRWRGPAYDAPIAPMAIASPELPAKDDYAPPLPNKDTRQSNLAGSNIARPSPTINTANVYPSIAPSGQSPVSDYRTRPLVDVNAANQASGRSPIQQKPPGAIGAGVGAHDVSKTLDMNPGPPSPEEQVDAVIGGASSSANQRPRAGSNAGLLPRAMMVEAPSQPTQAAEPVGRSSMSSIETPSREPSPPPEGEVEARAEWERARMKQKQKQKPKSRDISGGLGAAGDATSGANPASAARKTTLRGQLRPLQLVAADDDRAPLPDIPPISAASGRSFDAAGAATSPTTPSLGPKQHNGGAAMSTQQLQRQQARDQRRSVGHINMAMGMGGGELSSGANGPYPVFPSPSTGATPGGRQYSGMLPQRSLVPPFELQQRPDGLLSGLIGPDGVRRSVNDPEVCIECMMRDEDMIDVHVVGAGLWERESDREFEEALKVETEDDVRRERERAAAAAASVNGDEQSAGGHSSSHANIPPRYSPANTKVRVKRVGKHDPLTADRLKLHTQMNPPASSHRWRTLQNFLAVQAKFIAMEQRARHEEWEKTHPAEAAAARAASSTSASSKTRPIGTAAVNGIAPTTNSRSSSPLQETFAPVAARKSVSKNRSASAIAVKSSAKIIDDDDLPPAEKAARDRDVLLAREARRKNAASVPGTGTGAMSLSTSSPALSVSGSAAATTAVSGNKEGGKYNSKIMAPQVSLSPIMGDEERRRMTSTPIGTTSNSFASGPPRRPNAMANTTPLRGVSASDLRSVAGAMASSPAVPSTPDSLAPPSALAGASMLSTPRGFGGRTASQLSLAPSGSLMDMHVALAGTSNQADHRAGHGLGLPSPMELDRSTSASPQAFHGFPGDGDVSPADPAQAYRRSFQAGNDSRPGAAAFDSMSGKGGAGDRGSGAQNGGKKKKGIRGFFSKLSGSGSGGGGVNSGGNESFNDQTTDADDGEMSKRSEPIEASRNRRQSLSADSYLAPPPGIGGLLSRARRSTSSLLGGRESVDQPREMLYAEPPGIATPDRFDMGPFQPPLPPQRSQSKAPGPDSSGLEHPPGSQQASRERASSPLAGRRAVVGGAGVQQARSSSAASGNPSLSRPSPNMPLQPGTPNSMQTFNSSSRLSQGRTQTSSNMTHQSPVSPASSRTASMLSNGDYGMGRLSAGGPSKLPTIESSPGTVPMGLDEQSAPASFAGAAQQRPGRASMAEVRQPNRGSVASKIFGAGAANSNMAAPRESLNLTSGPPLRPTRSPRRAEGSGSPNSSLAGGPIGGGGPSLESQLQRQESLGRQRSASAMGMSMEPFPGGGSMGGGSSYRGGASYPGLRGDARREESGAFSLSSTQEDLLNQQRRGSVGSGSGAVTPVADNGSKRKSKLLKLPFGFNKSKSRSSMMPTDEKGPNPGTVAGASKSNSLRSRASANALGNGTLDDESPRKPRKSLALFERPRAFSSGAAIKDGNFPPRSQSALGNLPTQGFAGRGDLNHMQGVREGEESW
ncbi:unnamed protein product [Sympodiomycopsis kandeliae]